MSASRTSDPDRTMSGQCGQARGWSLSGGVNTFAYRSVTWASQFWHSGISGHPPISAVGVRVGTTLRTGLIVVVGGTTPYIPVETDDEVAGRVRVEHTHTLP